MTQYATRKPPLRLSPPPSFILHPSSFLPLLLFLLVGCATRPDVARLRSPDAEVRRLTVLKLARYGDPQAAPAIAALLDPLVEPARLVRAAAAVGLRMLGDVRALPVLVRATNDPDPLVRADVMRALGDLGGSDEVLVLGRVLREDPDSGVRLEAARAIGRLGGDEAARALLNGLDDTDESVAFASHRGLLKITGKDLPPSRRAWETLLRPKGE